MMVLVAGLRGEVELDLLHLPRDGLGLSFDDLVVTVGLEAGEGLSLPGGRPEDKSLKQLGEDIAAQVQGLAAPIETVRETGNRILHPKKHDVIAHPKVMRAEALECVLAARLIVETLYSDGAGAK